MGYHAGKHWFLHNKPVRVLVLLTISIVLVLSVSGLHQVEVFDKTDETAFETAFETPVIDETPVIGEPPLSSSAAFISHLNKQVPALMKIYDIPGVSIALIQQGKTTWTNAYGFADLRTKKNMTTDSYLRVQSISKPITAWGVMKLVEEGRIDLDIPVENYLTSWQFPETEYSEEKVTTRQLLSHTAGLPLGNIFDRYSPEEKIPSLKESLSKEAILIREPGASFSYSNTGYNLLELLIEEVSGRDFNEYMKDEILTPLGMRQSTFAWSKEIDPLVPYGYDLDGNAVPVYVYPEKASGGLFATAEDIADFVAAGMQGANHGMQGANHGMQGANQINHNYQINGDYVSSPDGTSSSGGIISSESVISPEGIVSPEGVSSSEGVISPEGIKVISPEAIEKLYTPMAENLGIYSLVFDGYGLGYYIENLSGGKRAVSHGGQGTGWMTHFHAVPETGDGIVILTNSQRSWPFIAFVLRDWAKWNGFSPVGMTRIIWGEFALWVLIGLLWFFALWQLWAVGEALKCGERRFAPLSKEDCGLTPLAKEHCRLAPLSKEHYRLRLLQSGLGLILVAVLVWCSTRDYLFISSVFPLASSWLAISALMLAVVLILSALCPKSES